MTYKNTELQRRFKMGKEEYDLTKTLPQKGTTSNSTNFIPRDKVKKKIHTGANWNEQEDRFTQTFYEQNLSQFWRPEDISLQGDLAVWHQLPREIQWAYAQNLAFLTFLDTKQGDAGVNIIARSMKDGEHQRKAVLNFMAAMENAVHAKSYSNIFMTYMSNEDIDGLFDWMEKNPHAQELLTLISTVYNDLDVSVSRRDFPKELGAIGQKEYDVYQWKAMVASVFLESWLFYSGFYYPLYYYGQGKLTQAGEIINLILRDESVHGLYIGQLAQELFESFDAETQEQMGEWLKNYFFSVYEEHLLLISEIYDVVNLSHDVKIFARYNANKALMNLGFDPLFDYEEVNPVVLNGLNTESKTHDFFSMKGNGYQKMKSEALKDSDFYFEAMEVK